ncbi:histidine kinase [Streptomyces sp. NBC_00053]|uniref:sensor histidine kinase n=1 Tax=unclassified Streptomyces TaxID=2593676 RepID=UPI00225642C0|nr:MULTISPECIES: histidine kinase [unclassified Streptomyces]MCX5099099.1 histidine kinase [Streptomyces sp. NBC_00439]MCX5498955.1 histidine kinase [Streptomyces sp. NBC_00052]MCX5552513.1 histidine kinase [Streptomyces sp. NBC_00051]WSP50521.1 histidine kinase [Streptomyces sp. NBC_01243]
MFRLLRPLAASVTYTRWLHLLIPGAGYSVWLFISPDSPWVPVLFAVPVGLLPGMRLAEGVQAQLLLAPEQRGRADASISAATAATWADRWRTVLWLETRILLAVPVWLATVWLSATSADLVLTAAGNGPSDEWLVRGVEPHWWYALLTPLPLVALLSLVVLSGRLITKAAERLLGPSPVQRLTALEERTEQLLERNRIARELHDSIGHALTVAVVQAGAARAARDPDFTERALAAIEETGRDALDDLERVLRVLRESGTPVGQRPTLVEADRLLDSARGSGAEIDADVSGPLEQVPGAVSREGYRILQESLTNVLRHSGTVPVRVRIAVTGGRLELEVTNPLNDPAADPAAVPGSGSGLRGIRERAALLGGRAETGPHEGKWRVRARLPLDGIRAAP